MSDFWSGWVIVLTSINIVACFWLIWWAKRPRAGEGTSDETTGHTWDDGELAELNNPMPRWWLGMFYISLFFGIAYLVLFPGMGKFAGTLGWTQIEQYEAEVKEADAKFGPLFARYSKTDIPTLAQDAEAVEIGRRLFLNYCATCHGSDAKGARGFPNLADSDWLYGDTPESIKTTITHGRSGVMPPFGAALGGEQGVKEMAEYVLSLSGRGKSAEMAKEGEKKFALCIACHGADGTGNQQIGAPNLTDDTWLYSGFPATVQATIRDGRNGQMPPHGNFLGEDKVHLLTTYVYSLRM